LNEQESARPRVSVVPHVTIVAPIGNVEPLAGEHVTGALDAPDVTLAAAKVTASGAPSGDTIETGAGHASARDATVRVGWTGDCVQAPSTRTNDPRVADTIERRPGLALLRTSTLPTVELVRDRDQDGAVSGGRAARIAGSA
jgi:hypothetical protein